MSLVDYAKEYAFDETVGVYIVEPEQPVIDPAAVVDELFDSYSQQLEVNHGDCCDLPLMHVLVGFTRKVGWHGAPSDMRERTLIACSPSGFMNWVDTGCGGLMAVVPGVLEGDPIEMWANYLKAYVGANSMPRTQYKLGVYTEQSFNLSNARFDLPDGPMVTPSKSYCRTESIRTLPIDSIYAMEVMIRVGKLPSALVYAPINDNISVTYLSGLSAAKNNDQLKYLSAPQPQEDFNVNSVIDTLRSMIL